jgi:hypothetical protein
MTAKAKPRPLAGGAGEGTVDQAAERVGTEYRSKSPTRKATSLFEQLVALAHHTRMFEHAHGPDRRPGKGWWSPIEEGPAHHVRARRRRRS